MSKSPKSYTKTIKKGFANEYSFGENEYDITSGSDEWLWYGIIIYIVIFFIYTYYY